MAAGQRRQPRQGPPEADKTLPAVPVQLTPPLRSRQHQRLPPELLLLPPGRRPGSHPPALPPRVREVRPAASEGVDARDAQQPQGLTLKCQRVRDWHWGNRPECGAWPAVSSWERPPPDPMVSSCLADGQVPSCGSPARGTSGAEAQGPPCQERHLLRPHRARPTRGARPRPRLLALRGLHACERVA